jgi:hypothetical protein
MEGTNIAVLITMMSTGAAIVAIANRDPATTGMIISGAIANSAPPPPAPAYRGSGNAHVNWCYNQYRSYRASDNTFQPYNGPRKQCVSPYY